MGALPLPVFPRFAVPRLALPMGAGLAGFTALLREDCCIISISSSRRMSFGRAASTSGSMSCTRVTCQLTFYRLRCPSSMQTHPP